MRTHALLKKLIAGLSLLVPGLLLSATSQGLALDGRPLDTPPRMMGIAKGTYPEELTRRGKFFDGTVTVNFVLTAEGKMEEPRIVQNSHAAFVAPALQLLHSSLYAPAMIAGKPVACRFQLILPFDGSSDGGTFKGSQPYAVSPKSPPEYPPNLRYDQAPMIITVCDPVYPFELLLAGTQGKARVRYLLDPSGHVSAAEVVSATKPEFGAALVAAVETWRFTPAGLKGIATTTLLVHDYEFSAKMAFADSAEKRALNLWKEKPDSIVDASSLEGKPQPFYRVEAQYPRALAPQHPPGEAEVEFVIDENGRVRLPRVLSATQPEFGWAAVTAIRQWLYDPPKSHGRSVDVRMRTSIAFAP